MVTIIDMTSELAKLTMFHGRTPTTPPAARNEPCRATARNTRTSSQSIEAEPLPVIMIQYCIVAYRICRSLKSKCIAIFATDDDEG